MPQQYQQLNIMLKCLFRSFYAKTYSLKRKTFCRPEEFDWLKKKYQGNPLHQEKMQYLRLQQSQNTLGNFYYDKHLDDLKEEDLYFLMQSDLDYHIKREKLTKSIRSCFFKCFIMKEFHIFCEFQIKRTIVAFNQEISSMPLFQISFCLEVINELYEIKVPLNLNLLEKRLLRQAQSSDGGIASQMILISGYLVEMGKKLPIVINQKNLENWIEHSNNFNFGVIYYIHKSFDGLKIPLGNKLEQKLKEDMKLAIRNLKCPLFQSNYIVFLLKNYPEYVQYVNLFYITSRAYTAYLNFYKSNRNLKIPPHKIPQIIIQKSNLVTFGEIIESRMALGLDNALTLAKRLSQFFTFSLKPVSAFILFIRRNNIIDPQVEYYIQKALAKKLNLPQKNNKIDFQQQFEYNINIVITILSHLCSKQMCSVNFWKRVVKFIEQLVEKNQQVQLIPFQNKTYTNLLQLVTTKNFKEETREIVFKNTVTLLRINDWQSTQIMLLTKLLSFSRIGQDEIWILIEKKFQSVLKQQGKIDQQTLSKIVFSFNVMRKGSYQMWCKFNELLGNQAKQTILVKVNAPGSLAKSFLKYNNKKSVDKLV